MTTNAGGGGSSRPGPGNFAPGEEADHFAKHAGEWPSGMMQQQYVGGARQLLSVPVGGNILKKTRANGDVLPYNAATNEFGAMAGDGTIRTFFRPTESLEYWNGQ
jgi:pyocin large subunit-like protein